MWPRALVTVALRGPAKGLLLASVAGWIAMAWLVTRDSIPHSAMLVAHHSHATPALDLPGRFTWVWLAMILAMAPPLLLREVGRLWRTSLRRLRHLTIGWFVCGYVSVWLAAGVALSSIPVSISTSVRLGVVVALIAIWQCSPARQRCLNACHRVPMLRLFGTRAQYDSLKYGISIGCYCAAACDPLMLLVLLATSYHLVAMAIALVLTTNERYSPARRPGWRLPMLRGRSIEWPGYSVGDAPSVRCAP